MRRPLKLCLVASMALVACNQGAPLSTLAPSPADASQDPLDGSRMPGVAGAGAAQPPSDAGAAVADATTIEPTIDAAEADGESSGDLLPSDGGRAPYRAIGVATGEVHACALLDDHRVKCWGNDSFGQLGYGDTRDRGGARTDMGDALPTVDLGTGRTAVAIAAGHYATCALLDDGSLKCWGEVGAALGGFPPDGDVGAAPGQMGDHLAPLDFGGRKAVHLAMGAFVAGCASLDDETIWCWDVDTKPWPQLGLPAKPVTALSSAAGGLVALYDDGSVSPMLPNGGNVPLFTSDHRVRAVAGSQGGGTCFLLDDGTTTCEVAPADWLEGPAGAIAIGVELDGALCSAFSDGSVRCQGQTCVQPTYYPCASDGSFALGAAVVAMTSNGTNFGCAVLVDGNIKCWDGSSAGPPSVWLGSELDATTRPDGGITYGAWHPVDLGTHP